MPPKPPSFGSQAYWEDRFTANPNPFEWLESPAITDPALVAALDACGEERPEILHVGCGTSELSFHIRTHVKDPEQIHNVDYSEKAIEIGRAKEREIYDVAGKGGKGKKPAGVPQPSSSLTNESSTLERVPEGKPVQPTDDTVSVQSLQETEPRSSQPPNRFMRWSTIDLLSVPSLISACKPRSYSLIIEKSTSDSIACSDDVSISMPYPLISPRGLSTDPISPPSSTSPAPDTVIPRPTSSIPIHPLQILGLHLAFITKPGGRWISVSYSNTRFPFLSVAEYDPSPSSSFEDDGIPEELTAHGFPDTRGLWKLEQKYAIEVPPPPKDAAHAVNLNAPKVMHWIYVLVRTEKEVVLGVNQAFMGE